jgi:hypothetical protein
MSALWAALGATGLEIGLLDVFFAALKDNEAGFLAAWPRAPMLPFRGDWSANRSIESLSGAESRGRA